MNARRKRSAGSTPRRANRGKHRQPSLMARLRAPITVLIFGLFAVAGVAAGLVWLDRPIRTVVVEGAFDAVTPEAVQASVLPAVSGGLLSVDIDRVREAVLTVPWVDRVRISRRWPDSLRVSVTEQVAAARWGDSELLNTRGELFDPAGRDPGRRLPLLVGPDGSHWQVAQRYLAVRGTLAGRGLAVIRLELDERRAWHLILSDGLEVRLGRTATDQRLGRLALVALPVLTRASGEAAYVDLRYTNGFAVGWAPVPPVPADQDRTDGDDQEI